MIRSGVVTNDLTKTLREEMPLTINGRVDNPIPTNVYGPKPLSSVCTELWDRPPKKLKPKPYNRGCVFDLNGN